MEHCPVFPILFPVPISLHPIGAKRLHGGGAGSWFQGLPTADAGDAQISGRKPVVLTTLPEEGEQRTGRSSSLAARESCFM
jgi:hypothetical protein